MKVAIASDLHDNTSALEWFFSVCKQRGVTHCVFLGDLIRPTLAKPLFSFFEKVFFVFGNNDGDRVHITKFCQDNVVLADDCFLEVEVDGTKLFVTHYPLLGRLAAESGRYKAAFYGHDHVKNAEQVGGCLLVNPGELYGDITGTISFYVFDTESCSGEFVIKE